PSELAEPDIANGRLPLPAAVGSGMTDTSEPSRRRSSTNTAAAALDSVAVPSPRRTTRKVGGAPGQMPTRLQSTQAPWPSHTVVAVPPQGVPASSAGFDGTPPVQRSAVHGLPSTGRSVSSAASVTSPAASQTLWRQSPAVCAAIGVPAGSVGAVQVPSPGLHVPARPQAPAAGQVTGAGSTHTAGKLACAAASP